MITHILRLNPAPFDKVKTGQKTIEMRLWDEKRQRMQVDDMIRFEKLPDANESLLCKIVALHRFSNFTAMCEALPLAAMGYEGESLKAWQESRDHGMSSYYSTEDELKYGVVGIDLMVMKP